MMRSYESTSAERRVTLGTFAGFYENKPTLYLHHEGSRQRIAAIEGSRFAPNLNATPGITSNDQDRSTRSAIIPIVHTPLLVSSPNPHSQRIQFPSDWTLLGGCTAPRVTPRGWEGVKPGPQSILLLEGEEEHEVTRSFGDGS